MRLLHYPGIAFGFGYLAFAPCGRKLLGGNLHFHALWDLDSDAATPAWSYDRCLTAKVAVSPCGRYFAGSAMRGVYVWDSRKLGEPRFLGMPVTALSRFGDIPTAVFSPDGAELLAIANGGVVMRWRVGSWNHRSAIGSHWHRLAGKGARFDDVLAVSPDCSTLATTHRTSDNALFGIKLWDYPDGHYRRGVDFEEEAGAIRFSPDGRLLASIHDFRSVRVRETATLSTVAEYRPKTRKRDGRDAALDAAFHPSGRWLAVTGSHGRVDCLDAGTWRVSRSFDWKLGDTNGVAFSPDGTLAAVSGEKGRIAVWDVEG